VTAAALKLHNESKKSTLIRKSEIFNHLFDEILESVTVIAGSLNIDFYLAGAVARDYHLQRSLDYTPKRKTEDIDFAVMVSNESEYHELRNELVATGNFCEHSNPIKLIYKEKVEVDLLPFGAIEEEGIVRITRPKLFIIEVPGFKLLNEYSELLPWNEKISTRICALEGVVLLKLIANDDKPERTKDLIDIQRIIELYFNLFSNEVYDVHFDILSIYDHTDLDYHLRVCAHLIGRKMKIMLAKDEILFQRLVGILKKQKDHFWSDLLNGIIE
jgi:predicted nucleotidyltransferase